VSKTLDRMDALGFLRTLMKRHGRPERLVTDKLRSRRAVLKKLGTKDERVADRWESNRAENPHRALRGRGRVMLRFRRISLPAGVRLGRRRKSTIASTRDGASRARPLPGRTYYRTDWVAGPAAPPEILRIGPNRDGLAFVPRHPTGGTGPGGRRSRSTSSRAILPCLTTFPLRPAPPRPRSTPSAWGSTASTRRGAARTRTPRRSPCWAMTSTRCWVGTCTSCATTAIRTARPFRPRPARWSRRGSRAVPCGSSTSSFGDATGASSQPRSRPGPCLEARAAW
jgi:hypothetical protein